ncbi:MAG: hypothetical protein NT027_01990 [Proteobacteria bacterium]|nr:hypothetical protein [Pseudomonadota bacterium]
MNESEFSKLNESLNKLKNVQPTDAELKRWLGIPKLQTKKINAKKTSLIVQMTKYAVAASIGFGIATWLNRSEIGESSSNHFAESSIQMTYEFDSY